MILRCWEEPLTIIEPFSYSFGSAAVSIDRMADVRTETGHNVRDAMRTTHIST